MQGECLKTNKVRYATARAAFDAIQQVYWGRRTKTQPRRVYFCKHCHGYHLSSKGDLWDRRHRLSHAKKRQRIEHAESNSR